MAPATGAPIENDENARPSPAKAAAGLKDRSQKLDRTIAKKRASTSLMKYRFEPTESRLQCMEVTVNYGVFPPEMNLFLG